MSRRGLAGALWFIGAVQFLILELIAETQSDGYTSRMYMSDLGVWDGISAIIFNSTVILFGVFTLAGVVLVWNDKAFGYLPYLVAISGIGSILTGWFNWSYGNLHSFFATIMFGAAALACLYSVLYQSSPTRYIYLALGIIGAVFLLLLAFKIDLGLGIGGIERIAVYSVIFWEISFATIIMNKPEGPLVTKA